MHQGGSKYANLFSRSWYKLVPGHSCQDGGLGCYCVVLDALSTRGAAKLRAQQRQIGHGNTYSHRFDQWVTGPDDFSSSARAADAYFKCVNANGGINGRPVNYIIGDDQWRPDVASQVATKLVKDDHVVAMIGSNSIVECRANTGLYDRENVIVIDIGVAHECFTSANISPMNQGPRLSGVGMLRFAAEHLGVKKVACVVGNIPGAVDWLCNGFATWGKKHGVTVRNVVTDPSTPDFTSAMLEASSSSPDAILLCFTKGGIIQALVAAEDQDLVKNYKFLSLASGYVVGLPKTIGTYWSDRFWTQLEFTPLDGTGPDNQNWIAIMDKYASNNDPRDTFS
jgi:branched-chain amino acid transport system substrate-binding protein